MRGSLVAGLIAAMLGMASPAPHSLVTANDAIDVVTTGSVSGGGSVQATPPAASPAFRTLLGALSGETAQETFDAAADLPSRAERLAIQWAAIQHHPGAIAAADIARFAAEAPGFATPATYAARLEQALIAARAGPESVLAALGGKTPQTVDGQIALARAYLAGGDAERATSLARSVWIDHFLTVDQEVEVLEALGALIDRDAHWKRAMHLMMHDRARGSERLLTFLTPAQRTLVVARAAVSRNEADAKAKLDAVDPSLHGNPVYIYSRAQRARQFELWHSAVEWLNKAPDNLPDAAEWWYERRTLIRRLLDEGLPELAYEAAAGYTKGPDGRLVEARFHAGWIALSFLKDAAAAKAQFTGMIEHSTLPDSVTQAHYWLGRANLALGDTAGARAAFEEAARFATVFYGQLARAELGLEGVDIRPLPGWQPSEATVFESNAVVQAVHLLATSGERSKAIALLRHHATTLNSGGELLLAAQLAQELGAHNLAISIAGSADQKGIPLDFYSFPKDGLPDDAQLAADRAAVFAVVRQESMFQIDAVSSAGARGLMQLMPGTAQEVAREVGLEYSPGRLVSDPQYNALLGSTYLQAQLDRYDGSLVLAAAAYNAGPGNADKWIRAYGDPRADNVDPVIWVELIPFQETRTYVKRVLGNYLVYRARLGDSPITLHQALRTID